MSCAFEQIPARARPHRREDRVVVLEHRQDEHTDIRAAADDLPRRLDPVQLRHMQVHHDDIRFELERKLDGVAAVRRFADELEPVLERCDRS